MSSAQSIPTEDDVGEKLCGVCKVPISIHVGKPGIGKCLGGAFTKAFESLVKSVQGLTDQLQAERSEAKKEREEAKDREVRLNVQLRELRSEVSELTGELEFIKARCISAQSESRTQPNQDKKIKKKSVPSLPRNQTETEEDHKNSKEQTRPWADVCRGAEVNESESESNESQRPPSPMSSTSKEKHGQETRITNSTKDTMDTKDTKDTKRTRTVRPKPKIDPLDSEDESWNLVVEKKPTPPKAVLYVGNLSPQTTTERLEKFISERMKSVGAETPRIFNSRMHANRKDENGSVIGARITVPTDAVPTLTSRSFWPRPAYARRWNFTPPAKPANLEETDYKHAGPPGDARPQNN